MFPCLIYNVSIIAVGNAEWEDASHARIRILWRTVEQLASDIFNWATNEGHINEVFTVYELHSGEDTEDSGK